MKVRYVLAIMALGQGLLRPALAQDEEAASAPATSEVTGAEELNVDAIKKKYWAAGDESQLGVVQNRLYSKKQKFALGVLGGTALSDPFISIRPLGFTLGYNFSELWGLHLVGWKHNSATSGAYDVLQSGNNGSPKNVNTVLPDYYWGLETTASLLYGKLSFLGAKIVYYDLHLSGALGDTKTEWEHTLTYGAGIGQRFYITQSFSVRLDYRFQYYRETVKEKVIPQILGETQGVRSNFTHNIHFGVDYLFGVF